MKLDISDSTINGHVLDDEGSVCSTVNGQYNKRPCAG
jgi:hypothetical protein